MRISTSECGICPINNIRVIDILAQDITVCEPCDETLVAQETQCVSCTNSELLITDSISGKRTCQACSSDETVVDNKCEPCLEADGNYIDNAVCEACTFPNGFKNGSCVLCGEKEKIEDYKCIACKSNEEVSEDQLSCQPIKCRVDQIVQDGTCVTC